jgi:tetratricopeptide (TPR) repeat protein
LPATRDAFCSACGAEIDDSPAEAGTNPAAAPAVPDLLRWEAVPAPEAITTGLPPRPPEEMPPSPRPPVEILAQTQVALQIENGIQPARPRQVVIALTADSLWIQDIWQLRRVPLPAIGTLESRRNGRELVLTSPPESPVETLTLNFASASQGQHWHGELDARRQECGPAALPVDRIVPEGVALVGQAPAVPHEILGQVEYTDRTPWLADRGLQLRAALLGADTVVDLFRHNCTDLGAGGRRVCGLAVRVENPDDRGRMRLRWYGEEVRALINRLLLLLVLQTTLLFLAATFCAGVTSRFNGASGETLEQSLASMGLVFAILFSWPLALLALLWILRWPGLLRPAGLAVLAATTGRGLTVILAHLLATWTTGGSLSGRQSWFLLDPIDWAFIIFGMVLCARAWRLARDASQILPPVWQDDSPARRAWAHGLFAATGLYALAFLGFAGFGRYQLSAHLLQPGVDPVREQRALLALNEGADLANRGDFASAEQSLQRSLRIWEELTATGRSSPPAYRANLAQTLYNLGWIRHRQGRMDEAEKYYSRAVALGDELADAPQVEDTLKGSLADARRVLDDLRGDRSGKLLGEKDQVAQRKYEAALVKAEQGAAEAEGLLREAITLWEEILPQATSPEYRKDAVAQLASAYRVLAEVQQSRGKPGEVEATLRKAIEYGEKAVALDPDRPLRKHSLELARRMLDRHREQAFQEEVNRLCAAERFADALDVCWRGIDEQEKRLPTARDRDAAISLLAYRLDRFAWLLAHCPDQRVRDTKAAVRRARRATDLKPEIGDYWYTLAMVQYRNGDWRESLASLEKVKARENEYDGSAWLLLAMNRQRLAQKEEARAAFRNAIEWIDKRKREAEDNALLRFQYEMMRPALDALRREAENLLEGKDPSGARAA